MVPANAPPTRTARRRSSNAGRRSSGKSSRSAPKRWQPGEKRRRWRRAFTASPNGKSSRSAPKLWQPGEKRRRWRRAFTASPNDKTGANRAAEPLGARFGAALDHPQHPPDVDDGAALRDVGEGSGGAGLVDALVVQPADDQDARTW